MNFKDTHDLNNGMVAWPKDTDTSPKYPVDDVEFDLVDGLRVAITKLKVENAELKLEMAHLKISYKMAYGKCLNSEEKAIFEEHERKMLDPCKDGK